MYSYLARRLFLFGLTVIGALVLIFLIVRLVPGNPADIIMGEYAGTLSEEKLQAVKEDLGLSEPLHVQLWIYLKSFLTGDFGKSFRTPTPVINRIGITLPYTLRLIGGAIFFSILIGLPLGILAVTHKNTFLDYASVTGSLVWLSAPIFWYGLLLVFFVSYKLGLTPTHGAVDPIQGGFLPMLHHLALPAFCLGSRGAGQIARMTRSTMLEVFNEDYINTARAKGLSERIVVYKHTLRNAAIPLVTVVGATIAYSIGSSIIVESVFARPGMGRMMADALYARDFPVIQACAALFAGWSAFMNLIVDLSYAIIDPRVTYD